MVGSLVYAVCCTRPDLSFAVTKLSQHLAAPRNCDWIMLKHVFRYVKATVDNKLIYRKNPDGLRLSAFSDSDWASCKDDRRSVTGYCFSLSATGPVVTWKSRKQRTVALSSCEAEYMAMATATQEALYLLQLLEDMTGVRQETVEIQCDNQGSILLAENPVKHDRSKHIDIRFHFLRTHVQNGNVSFQYVPSGENLADIFTKPCSKRKLTEFTGLLFGVYF